jgi:hypothetical protein
MPAGVKAAVPTITLRAPCATSAAARSAYARYGTGRQHAHQVVVRAAAHGGIEVNYLNLGEGRELAQHFFRRIGFQGFLAALNQLHHLAFHQVDARQNHGATRTGMPRLSSSSFNWFTV